MHGPINVKSPNNISKWQMRFNSAFKELIEELIQGGDNRYLQSPSCLIRRLHVWNQAFEMYVHTFCCCWT
jgi:hypothetical protein